MKRMTAQPWRGGGVGGGGRKRDSRDKKKEGRGHAGSSGVTLIKSHFTFKCREADNQSNVTVEFKSSVVRTLCCEPRTTIQLLITVNIKCVSKKTHF